MVKMDEETIKPIMQKHYTLREVSDEEWRVILRIRQAEKPYTLREVTDEEWKVILRSRQVETLIWHVRRGEIEVTERMEYVRPRQKT